MPPPTNVGPSGARPVQTLAEGWPDQDTRALLADRAIADKHWDVRQATVHALARSWPDESTRTLVLDRATTDPDGDVRREALRALTQGWPDDITRI